MRVLPYIAILILICLSALFSGSELAYASSNELKLRNSKNELAYKIFTNYKLALISILVGNNLVNIGSSALATSIAISLLGDSGAWLATFIMTVLIIIFGEITPKQLSSRYPEKVACIVALPIRIWMIITKPIVIVANAFVKLVSRIWKKSMIDDAVTEDDLETIIETAEDEGVVDSDTADLLQGALDFDDIPVYEILTPRVDMYALNLYDNKEKNIDKIFKSKFTRIPIYLETPDHIVGILNITYTLRVLASKKELDIEAIMKSAHFVYKTTPLSEALKVMRKEDCHMLIVTDEYGGTMGLVTMEDILEQLVGEIFDEKDIFDEEFVELSEDRFDVDGDMRLEDFFEELDMDEEDEIGDDNVTIGGWAIEKIEKYPEVGDRFSYKNLHFKVTEAEDMRVLGLEVIRE